MKTIEKKEPYLHILNTQGNIYEEFLPDQVLTHKNLNKVVNYFEDQDRLSRIYLIGVGIGCGINIVSYSNSHIEIGQGVGITTDGDIIKTETRRFQYYSELTDRADYALFEGRQVYEIYEQEGAGRLRDELPLTSFNSNELGSLKDYIVIAYVENYTEDEGLCGGSGCDETGNKVYSSLKFLITHKNNYSALISNDTIYKSHDVLSYYDTLPELCMPRLLLTKNNTTSGISIHDQFKNSFFLKNDLYNGITTIIRKFSHRINFAKFGITIPQITAYFDDIFTVTEEQFIQYKYDLLKDLIDTYREIRELILHTRFECVANVNAFPKHLLLGTLEEQTRLQTRHNFYPSPTVSENDQNLMSIRALSIKFFNQLKEYKIPNVSTATIKVTPSKSYEFKLSERTIPYYYETKNSLISNWNPISIQERKPKNQLGYHVSNLKNIPCIQEPLKYSHLDKDFYRIEGHLGKDFRLALRKINSLKAKYNLAFDVKTVSIGFPVNQVTLDDDKCDTKDYSILLKTWEQEFCCTAESAIEFFQKYQYDNLGDNDTSTQVYSLVAFQTQQVLQLLGKEKNTDTNAGKFEAKTINTNTAAAESTPVAQRYESSIQYAMDQAYLHVGTQDVPAGYVSGVALQIIDQILDTNDRDDDYFFYTESAVKIVAGLSEIKRLFLQSLDEIYNTEKWTALNNAIDLLCSDVDQVLFSISEAGEDATFGTRTHDKMYEYFIYDLSKICCLKGKFTWLKEQIDNIRYDIYRELILSKLIEKHPGVEHMAGVPKGGTFLMVYLGGTEELLEDESVLRQFNGLVQFDFALPYMCCSDCPPETVVYNLEPETTLVIAKTKYCLPEDEGQVDFIAQSSGDGVITSPQGDAFIVATDNGYAFDPTAVPDDLIGEILTFLVDGKVPITPVEICVYKFPTDITANHESPVWSDAGITMDLTVSHEALTYAYNYTYTWKRADGSEIGTGTDLSGISFENEGDRFEETFTLTIGIEGTPVACTVVVDVPVDESRAIDIDVPEIICYNLIETSPTWVEVIVTPFGAALTSPQEPNDTPSFIEQNDAGNYFIDPLKVPHDLAGDEITFAVNGTPIEGKSTRIGMLPFAINIDTIAHEVVQWDETGVFVNIRAVHQFQSESYIAYRWIDVNNNDAEIGITRNLTNHRIEDFGEDSVTVNYKVIMTVIGLEDSCETSFDFNFTITRPTLDIARGLCSPESVELNVNLDDIVTTSLDNNVIQNISDTITFESGQVSNSDIGNAIEIFVNGSLAATTKVYKVPTQANVTANDDFVRWDGEDVIVNLNASYTIPDVMNPENYLEIKWFDNGGNLIPDNDLNEYAISTDDGTVETTFSVTVCVQSDLGVVDPCETPSIDVPISHTRPTPDLERGYCYDVIVVDDIDISISTDIELTSPQGSDFIIDDGSEYKFRLSQVPDSLIGQRIGFEIGGVEVGHTFVYKMPTDLSGITENIRWNDNELTVNLTPNYTLPTAIINPENYLRFTWRNDSNQIVNTPSSEVIAATSGGVNKIYTLSVSVNPELMDTDPCNSTPVNVPINEDQPEPEPTLPTDLGLLDRYCWKEGDDPLNIPIPVAPSDFIIASPQEDSQHDFVKQNTVTHTFIASSVPDSSLGNAIQLQIDGTTIDNTRVYKLPFDESIAHDRQNSQWGQGTYQFRVNHSFDDKDYFNYDVVHIATGQTIEQVALGTFKVSAETTINERFKVTISVDGLDCMSVNTITVEDTRDPSGPTNPVGRSLSCDVSYTERMNILELDLALANFSNNIKDQEFESSMRNEILMPLKTLIDTLKASRNLSGEVSNTLNKINALRDKLTNDYLNDTRIKNFKERFLNLDELFEIMVLELLRCEDGVATDTLELVNEFFRISSERNSIYGETTRVKIDSTYINDYNAFDPSMTTKLNDNFSK